MVKRRTRRNNPKSKKQTRGRGFLDMFNRKPTPVYSDKTWKKEGDQYEHDGYTVVKQLVDEYERAGRLANGFSASRVDAMLSKYVDEPRTIDGLNRLDKWTKRLLKSKSYAKPGNAFMKEILELQHVSLV